MTTALLLAVHLVVTAPVLPAQAAPLASPDTIQGLPAHVAAELAQQALSGDPVASEQALARLTAWSGTSAQVGATPSDGETGGSLARLRRVLSGWVGTGQSVGSSDATGSATSGFGSGMPGAGWLPGGGVPAGIVLLLGFAVWVLLRWRRYLARRGSGYASWGPSITRAAQLLASGTDPEQVSRETGLALDVLGVVASRRLRPAPMPGRSSS